MLVLIYAAPTCVPRRLILSTTLLYHTSLFGPAQYDIPAFAMVTFHPARQDKISSVAVVDVVAKVIRGVGSEGGQNIVEVGYCVPILEPPSVF